VLGLTAAWLLPVPETVRHVMYVQAAMPCGIFSIVIARHFDVSPLTAMRVAVTTIVLGLATIPLWLQVGARWLEIGF